MRSSLVLQFTSAPLACFVVGCILMSAATSSRALDTNVPRQQPGPENRSVKQEIQLAASYLTGRGVAQDFALSAYWYERAANAGDPLAQNEIGYFYQAGIGVARDSARAAQWYQRAADGGFLEAKVNLGLAYLWGLGVRKDAQLGYELIHQAAIRDCGLADAYLGEMYYFGLGVPMDRNAARSWYEKGAHFNDSIAQYRLAAMLVAANPSKRDLLKAEKLFRQSIKGGYVPAQHSLGIILINHPELPARQNEALDHLQSASEGGIWKSSAVLGAIYRDGNSVAIDPAKAFYYFRLAQLQGGETARQKVANDLAILSRELRPDQVASIVSETDDWVKIHPLTLQFIYKDTDSSSEFPVFAVSAAIDDTHAGRLIPTSPAKSDP